MKKNTSHSNTLQQKLLWAGVTCVTLVAFFLIYHYNWSTSILTIVWLVWFIIATTLGLFTTQGKQLLVFAKEAKTELDKVTWPARQETTQTTMIVIVMVGITGLVLWGIDSCMIWAIGKVTHLG